MLEMLKARKAQLEAQGKKGFTLMEMLIVIAIIAILIAIAIPVFTQQMDRANAATDEANIRSGYASAQAAVMLATPGSTIPESFTLMKDGSVDDMGTPYVCLGNSTSLGTAVEIGGITGVSWEKGNGITYTYDEEEGKITGISVD